MKREVEKKRELGFRFVRFISKSICLFAIGMFFLVGCSNEGSTENVVDAFTSKDAVQDDLLAYINDSLIPLQNEESALMQKYNNEIDNPENGDQQLYTTLQAIVPDYKKLIERIEEVHPVTTEVRDLHEMYIGTANKQYNAMLQLQAAIENQDTNLVSEANEKLDEARKGGRDFNIALDDLAKKHNVVDASEEDSKK